MTTLKNFLNSAEANLCAAFLKNAGIDATVFEDSAYGQALDAIRSSVRIVVPDEQLEEARTVLEEYQRGEDVEG
ncbi:MAG: putative signal transducing protein [Verrucomicrobiales bacterium]